MSDLSPDGLVVRSARQNDGLARRTRLREFQAQLLDRMQAARSGAAATNNRLGIVIGQQRWLIDLKEAGEIVSVGTIASVPLTRPWYRGLTNMRGNLVSVIDFAEFQGLAPTQIDKESRIVAFSASIAPNTGLLVSRVMGLRDLDEMTREANPAAASAWSSAMYTDRDANQWFELRLSTIVEDPQFLHIGQ